MKETEIKEIWERGKKEDILELKDKIRSNGDDNPLRIIHRKSESLERYFHNHTPEMGYSWHPTRYEWEGYTFLLERLP